MFDFGSTGDVLGAPFKMCIMFAGFIDILVFPHMKEKAPMQLNLIIIQIFPDIAHSAHSSVKVLQHV